MFPANRFAPTNIRSPEPTGICMRCGFYFFLKDLELQYQWAGPSLVNLQILVCRRRCLDVPQEQLRTIVIGADPIPPRRPSPTFYAQQSAAPGYTAPPWELLDDAFVPLFDDDGAPLLAE